LSFHNNNDISEEGVVEIGLKITTENAGQFLEYHEAYGVLICVKHGYTVRNLANHLLVKVSATVGAVLGLADVAMHNYICSITGVCTLADKAIYSYICSVTSVCIYSVYKHVAPTFSDRY
jgi:hypothetical protein